MCWHVGFTCPLLCTVRSKIFLEFLKLLRCGLGVVVVVGDKTTLVIVGVWWSNSLWVSGGVIRCGVGGVVAVREKYARGDAHTLYQESKGVHDGRDREKGQGDNTGSPMPQRQTALL